MHGISLPALVAATRVTIAAVIAASVIAPAQAADEASDFPAKPIRIVVPYAAGGSVDLLARALGERVGAKLGQPVVVESRPGAGSNIGAAFVAKAPADGYTLLLGTSAALAVNVSLYKNLSYSPLKDFRPVMLATRLPSLVVVNASSPVKSMKELTPYLSSQGAQASYASAGNGTPAHLGGELYKKLANLPRLVHVPYKGGAPALADLLGNQTTMMIAIAPEALPMVKDGKLRALAVTTSQRLAQFPDLPTVAESGVPNYELVAWYGLVAPAGTPLPIVAKLNTAFNEALEDPKVRARLTDMGFDLVGGPPSVLENQMRSEAAKWAKVIKDSQIEMD
ncbi:Bug family tripartite tricarboxylate transporter substrate binding protein [Cupriavidus plantarum]|uniref:Tripartite-type tricarboxylate transporter receptor subunit TctC n=1 Tax=Cupriavidus plantarum TaxID=942865 RepID=A0A316ES11_9BURK|nr:tripartite tricarboxylate transporter substrate binding protein [Cupriavidus plantarum]PWK35244.1 tripartite-type tricarboxylate transporter receptor subunit TctC [Cupriavidus plantarum]